MPTITPTPNDAGSWHHDVDLSPGRTRVASHIDTDIHPSVRDNTPPTHVVIVEFSPELTDDTGNRVERDAGPSEIQARNGREVIPDPVTVNGRPYGGLVWVERGYDPTTHQHIRPGRDSKWRPDFDHWRVTHASLKRLDGGEVTDAARAKLDETAHQIAEAVGTPDQLYADRLKAARYQFDKAATALSEAQNAYDDAFNQVMEIENEALLERPRLTDEPGKVTKLTGPNSIHHPGPTGS